MSHEMSTRESVITVLKVTRVEVVLFTLIVAVILIYSFLISYLDFVTYYDPVSEIVGNRASEYLLELSDLLEGSGTGSTIAVAAIWSVIGAIIYTILWYIHEAYAGAQSAFKNAFQSVHPAHYSRTKAFFAVLFDKSIMIMSGLMVFVSIIIWLEFSVLGVISSSLQAFDGIGNQSPLLLIPQIGFLFLTMHQIAIFWRLFRGKHHRHFIR
jgi:uncharacterized membrane protein YeiB